MTARSDRWGQKNRPAQGWLPLDDLTCADMRAGSLRRHEAVREALVDALSHPKSPPRGVVAEELSRLTGEAVGENQVNNWCAPGKTDRKIPLEYLAALVIITKDLSLAEAALEGTGMRIISEDELAFLELGRMTAEDKARAKQRRALMERIGL